MPHKDPEQLRAYNAIWRAAHREELKAWRVTHREQRKAWQDAHQKELKAYALNYRAIHREERKASSAAYRATHPEERKANRTAYYLTHREEENARSAAYQIDHPEVIRTAQARRRARKKALPATLTTEQWLAILRAYENRCAYCEKRSQKLTQDHVIALSKGGGTTADNIVPACGPCNSKKKAGPPPSIPMVRLLI